MHADKDPFFEIRDASIRLNDRLVFRRTRWTVRRGEHWVIVGPNGSGKTVLCRALCGEYPVVEGSIDYRFRPLPGREPEQCIERLSFEGLAGADSLDGSPARWFSLEQEQSPRVSTLLSRDRVEGINPYEIVERSPGEVARWERHARRVIRLVGIESLLRQPLLSLSNGERRKVAIARALLRTPRLLILDDPFQGLDIRYRRHLRELLDALIRRNVVTLLLIGGRPAEWPRGMTHLLLVERCRVVAQGAVHTLRHDPRVSRLVNGARVEQPDPAPAKPGRLPRRAVSGRELIRLRAVQAAWGRTLILDGVDWTVSEGESWAVVGPNGAGKSTLLSFILGENPQVYANDVRVFGRRRGTGESVWEIKKKIGWVSPEFHLGFGLSLTGLEAVLTGFFDASVLREPTTARQRTGARQWLRQLRIAHLADRPFCLMSTGEQRLVLLARALVKRPRLLVLDEPCQGLDRGHRRLFVDAVDRLIRHGTTALYVTHQRDEIPPSIRRVLRLQKGQARPDSIQPQDRTNPCHPVARPASRRGRDGDEISRASRRSPNESATITHA